MKVFLDDLRPTPEGWHRTYTAAQTILLLKTRLVSELSLDNDLGDDQPEGYTVLDWLEEKVFFDSTFPIPEIAIHSSNAARQEYMQRAIASIKKIRANQEAGK
jgi:hypothetical protein